MALYPAGPLHATGCRSPGLPPAGPIRPSTTCSFPSNELIGIVARQTPRARSRWLLRLRGSTTAIDADAATLETVAAQIRSSFSLGRFGTPEEIATTALDLCARESAFIVGTEIIAD